MAIYKMLFGKLKILREEYFSGMENRQIK